MKLESVLLHASRLKTSAAEEVEAELFELKKWVDRAIEDFDKCIVPRSIPGTEQLHVAVAKYKAAREQLALLKSIAEEQTTTKEKS